MPFQILLSNGRRPLESSSENLSDVVVIIPWMALVFKTQPAPPFRDEGLNKGINGQ